MEVCINELIKRYDEINLLDRDQFNSLASKSLDFDFDLIPYNDFIRNQRIKILDRELFIYKHTIYAKWTYNMSFNYFFKNEFELKIQFDFIEHCFHPFHITYSEINFDPFESEDMVLSEDYIYPNVINKKYKKISFTKRQLVSHYTKRNTAIENILPSRTLRFNDLKYSNDPAEYKKNISLSLDVGDDWFDALANSHTVQFEAEKVKSISFTADHTNDRCFENLLMWAHYGEKHEGICLLFDERKLKKLFKEQFHKKDRFIPKRVRYSSKKAILKISGDDNAKRFLNKYQKTILYTKNTAWKYESEFRLMIMPDEKNNTFIRNIQDSLVAIVLGIKFNDTYKCVIDDQVKNMNQRIKLFKLHWSINGYFEIQDLNSTEQKHKCSDILQDFFITI